MANLNTHHPDSELIDKLGGTTKAAEFFDVSAPSISEWRKTGLPRARMMYLRLARPDLFGEDRRKSKSRTTRNQRRRKEDRASN
jgi:hypothetical protein